MNLTKDVLIPTITEQLRSPEGMVVPKLNDEAYGVWADKIASAVMSKIATLAKKPTGSWATYPGLKGFHDWIARRSVVSDALGMICKGIVNDLEYPFKGDYNDGLKYIESKSSPEAVEGFKNLFKLFRETLTLKEEPKKKASKKVAKKVSKKSKKVVKKTAKKKR